jgi:tripartite-type tricarboxylate transporter receptor subunit TctC
MRALAVTGVARSDALPDIPTVAEFLPVLHLGGHRRAEEHASEVIDKLNHEINAVLADADYQGAICRWVANHS